MSIMTFQADDAMGTKPGRRRVAKSSRDVAVKGHKKSVYLTEENARRLGVHAAVEFKSESEVVNWLIETHLRQWRVQVNTPSSSRSTSSSQLTESADCPMAN
jgi:hypothetical protein